MISLTMGKPGVGMLLSAQVAAAVAPVSNKSTLKSVLRSIPAVAVGLRGAAARVFGAAGDAGGAADASPRAVTRGESQNGGERDQRVKVDWLNATFPTPAISAPGLVAMLGRLFNRPVTGMEGRGMFGFSTGVKLRAYVGGSMADIGFLCYGGESQQGRWMLQFSGKGCALVSDWEGLQELLEGLEARITRADLACDFLDGEYTVDDAVRMHSEGGFTGQGRAPSTEVAGDWLDGQRGRTLYVGKGANGKMLRVYEKGIQLGDPLSPWVRYEVQLGNRDRVIPLDVLTQPTKYFAGCYPCLAQMVEEAACKIATTKTEGEVTLAHLLFHAKRCYGKVFGVLASLGGFSESELIEEVRIVGIPRRLIPSALDGGVSWADAKAQFFKRSNLLGADDILDKGKS